MQNFIHLVEQNIIGIILAIVGFIAAYIFYRRSLVCEQLAFIANSVQITGRDSKFTPDLKILYRNQEVERVTKSAVIIWNSGNTTIDGDRIVNADPLRLLVSMESEILDAYVTKVTRDVNAFSVRVHPESHNEIECSFDFLDSGDGAVIEVLYTGNEEINVQGTIRGIPQGVKSLGRIPDSSKETTIIEIVGSIVAAIICIGGGSLLILWGWGRSEWLFYIGAILSLVGIVLFPMAIAGLLWFLYKWITRRPQPPRVLLRRKVNKSA
jgi:hypothetical protein